jgi:hypothetical protein
MRVLVLLMLLAALFPAVLFPAAGIGEGRPLDLYFSYSPDQVYRYLGELGAKGRMAYARMELTWDLLFPVVYSLALMVALVIAAHSILPAASRLQYLRFFPALAVFADWGENLSLARVIHAYPDQPDALVTTASLFTSLKWVSLALAVIALVVLGALTVASHYGARSARH